MRIGVAREIKQREYRVALTPAGALELVQHGHEVTVEQDAGIGSGFTDDAYTAVGAMTDAATTLANIQAPVDRCGRRIMPSDGRGPRRGPGAASLHRWPRLDPRGELDPAPHRRPGRSADALVAASH
jgi:hypothetical protein